MNWKALRAHIQWTHKAAPQVALLCDLAVRDLEAACATLARHGHHFELAEGHQHPPDWPRVVYHHLEGRRTVGCQAELDELGFGWFGSPWDAELAEGYEAQFAGKGGVRRTQLPTGGATAPPRDWDPDRKERWKAEFLAARSARLNGGLEDGHRHGYQNSGNASRESDSAE